MKILLGLREKYEAHHNCKYTMEAIDAAVYLSSRYIADRFLPDKAIDLIDEAGSRARIEAFRKKKEDAICILSKPPDDYWQEIRTVQAMHEVVKKLDIRPTVNLDVDHIYLLTALIIVPVNRFYQAGKSRTMVMPLQMNLVN